MDSIQNIKSEIRKKYIELRKNIKDKDVKSIKILNKLLDTEEYKVSKVIAVYKSLDSEVNTTEFIKYFLNDGKIVALPRVIGNSLSFYKINNIDDTLIKSKFGVYEPEENINNYIGYESIDLLIVPGVCFDRYKNRVGFGKGFYDRFLAKTKLKNIGICFEDQVIKNGEILTNDTDVKVQKIITEKNIYV